MCYIFHLKSFESESDRPYLSVSEKHILFLQIIHNERENILTKPELMDAWNIGRTQFYELTRKFKSGEFPESK